MTRPPLQRNGPWVVVGVLAWAGVAWLGWMLWAQSPPRAGFDLALLLDAARRVAAGASPYDPALLAGASPDATGLFYSYPPPVAQVLSLVSWLPDGVALVLVGVAATTGAVLVSALLARVPGAAPRVTAGRTLAMLPLVLPFAVALLFGNLDAWYPLAYGLLLLAALPGGSRASAVAAGIALALVSVAKLHPAVLLVWLAVRAHAGRGGTAGVALVASLVAGVAVVGVSVLVWGPAPWADYLEVVQAGARADLVDPRNLAPVSLLGQIAGIDSTGLRIAQALVSLLATGVVIVVGWRLRDPLGSFAVAATASLIVLPVTWYHYPVALIPVGIAVWLGRPAARPAVLIGLLLVDAGIALAPLVWLGVLAVVLAATTSIRGQGEDPIPAGGTSGG